METKFKLIATGSKQPDIDIEKFSKSLPQHFHVELTGNDLYVYIRSNKPEDNNCQFEINRELDRLFFLTSVRIKAEMVKKMVTASFSTAWAIHGDLPDDIHPQSWTYNLALQLRLWEIASTCTEPLLKIIMLFQIIELAYPNNNNFKKYDAPDSPPDPLTECKLIRHLVVHAGEVDNYQLKLYCKFLDLPELMLDMTDPHYKKLILSKIPLFEHEAKKIINKSL